MTGIFISYRREDSGGHSGRLFDRLVARFGAAAVFLDHYDLPAGVDFTRAIDAALQAATVVLAIIGPRWLLARDAVGRPRLFQPDDFVHCELLAALNAGKRVIPLLVGGAALPHANDLPADLAPLVRLQACEVRDARFEDDVAALLALLPAHAGLSAAGSAARLIGSWLAEVSYPWGVNVTERFDFELDGDELIGSATYLTGVHPLEAVELLADGVRFIMHSEQVLGEVRRRVTHHYRARLEGDCLQLRLQSSGGFDDAPALRFSARRA